MLHIRVPATTANMGPGFDCLGTALKLYNEIWIEEIDNGIEIFSKTNKSIPKNENNLIYSTIKNFYEKEKLKLNGIRMIQEDNIPMTRGLGSSAACIVMGLIAANKLSGKNYSAEDLAQMAAKLEGHPDNSNPAILGGMIISAMDDEKMNYVKLDIPESVIFAAMIPGFPLSTSKARSVLPDTYTRKSMVFNSSRTGLTVASIMTGKLDNLRMSMDDSLHQPYRKKLIRGYDEIFAAAKKAGSKAEYLSGAGPTLMAIITDDIADEFEKEMKKTFETLPDKWEIKLLKPDMDGALAENI